MIMLEGPDLAGKTTTAKALHKMLSGSEIVHRGPPSTQDPFVEYLRPIEDAYYNGEFLILDRWHWGELIYGPILRGGTIMDEIQHEYLEMVMMRYGVTRLLLLPPMAILLQRYDERGDDLIGRNQLIRVADHYQHLEIDPDYSIHHIFDGVMSHSDLSYVIAQGRGYRSRANTFASWPSFIGPTRPEVLFIGERPAETHLGNFKTAFVPYRGTSGYHLLKCLRAIGARDITTPNDPWRAYAFVNAYDGCDDFMSLWGLLDRPAVVALGRKAFEAVHRFGVVTGRVPHPQFARRFHNRAVESYGSALIEAANGKDMGKWKG